jgi:hypothetical protein
MLGGSVEVYVGNGYLCVHKNNKEEPFVVFRNGQMDTPPSLLTAY